MAKQFVVMRECPSPIYYFAPVPVFIAKSRKSANAFIKAKRAPNTYYIKSVEAE